MNDNLNIARFNQILNVSNPDKVKKNLKKYFPKDTPDLFISNRKNKKYMILNPEKNKFIHFGSLSYEDFTKHQDKERQKNYLIRASNIRGDWRSDKFSPNNLSMYLLWNYNPNINYKLKYD